MPGIPASFGNVLAMAAAASTVWHSSYPRRITTGKIAVSFEIDRKLAPVHLVSTTSKFGDFADPAVN
jgi:hypothetical protein